MHIEWSDRSNRNESSDGQRELTDKAVPAGAEAGRGRRAGRTQRVERAAAAAAAQRAALQRACTKQLLS